jgi:hypothetical protein
VLLVAIILVADDSLSGTGLFTPQVDDSQALTEENVGRHPNLSGRFDIIL